MFAKPLLMTQKLICPDMPRILRRGPVYKCLPPSPQCMHLIGACPPFHLHEYLQCGNVTAYTLEANDIEHILKSLDAICQCLEMRHIRLSHLVHMQSNSAAKVVDTGLDDIGRRGKCIRKCCSRALTAATNGPAHGPNVLSVMQTAFTKGSLAS